MMVFDRFCSRVKNFMLRNFSTEFLCRHWPEVEWPIRARYMMAEKSFFPNRDHQYCSTLDICQVHAVVGEYYLGQYKDVSSNSNVEKVLFPKISTRDLNYEEINKYQNKRVVVNGVCVCVIKIDY